MPTEYYQSNRVITMTVRKKTSKYLLISGKGKTLGTHKTKADALRQERAIKASQARKRKKTRW